jgi:hypothetical protein
MSVKTRWERANDFTMTEYNVCMISAPAALSLYKSHSSDRAAPLIASIVDSPLGEGGGEQGGRRILSRHNRRAHFLLRVHNILIPSHNHVASPLRHRKELHTRTHTHTLTFCTHTHTHTYTHTHTHTHTRTHTNTNTNTNTNTCDYAARQ